MFKLQSDSGLQFSKLMKISSKSLIISRRNIYVKAMNMFVFCQHVFRSKVFDSENMFVYFSVGLVIYSL